MNYEQTLAFTSKFNSFNDEHRKFDRIENKRSLRPDLHLFILLDELFPSNENIVACANHDEIFLSIQQDQLLNQPDHVLIELIRCGVRLQDDGICIFV